MGYSNCCREKTFHYKIQGPRPFIDPNLQLCIPEVEAHVESVDCPSSHSIYAHYARDWPSPYSTNHFKEANLRQAMEEAQRSYAAWKKIQSQILEASQRYFFQ